MSRYLDSDAWTPTVRSCIPFRIELLLSYYPISTLPLAKDEVDKSFPATSEIAGNGMAYFTVTDKI